LRKGRFPQFERDGGNTSLVRINVSDLKSSPAPEPPSPIPTTLQLSTVLGSGMVLQRHPAQARVWGLAVPGDIVTVTCIPHSSSDNSAGPTANRSVVTAVAAKDGHWAARVSVTLAGNPWQIEISSPGGGKKKKPAPAPIILTDVLAGEVHVCSGYDTSTIHEF